MADGVGIMSVFITISDAQLASELIPDSSRVNESSVIHVNRWMIHFSNKKVVTPVPMVKRRSGYRGVVISTLYSCMHYAYIVTCMYL